MNLIKKDASVKNFEKVKTKKSERKKEIDRERERKPPI